MSIQNHFLLKMITISIMTKLVVASITTGEKLNKETITEFIDELKLIEEHTKNTHRHKYTMLRIINREIAISDMISLCQRLFGDIEIEEKVTVITIIHNENDQVHNPDDYHKNFVYALQKHVKNNEKYITMSKNLSVTVDHVEKTRLNDHSCIDETSEKLLNLTNDFSIFLTKSMFDICYAILKNAISNHMQWYINGLIKPESDLIHTHDKNLQDHSRKCLQHIIMSVGDSVRNGKIFIDPNGIVCRRGLYFDEFCKKFYEQTDRKYGVSYKRKDKFLFITWQHLLFNKHEKEFFDCIMRVSCQFVPMLEHACYVEPFNRLFTKSYARIIENCTFLLDVRTSLLKKHGFFQSYLINLNRCVTFKNHCELFFEKFGFHEHKETIEETYKIRNDKLCQEYRARKIVKIILDGKINNAKCIRLLQILKNTNLFAKINHQEMILVLDGKRLKRKALLAGASKYSSKKFTLITGREYNVSDCETLEVFTTRRHKEEANIVANRVVFWASNEPLECLTSRLNADESNFVPITTITTGKYDESDDIFNEVLEKFINATTSTLENVYCIVLTNVCEEVNIYCIHQKVRDKEFETISLLYKINSKYSTELLPDVHLTNGTTKWMYNVTKPMLDNLVSNIKCYLMGYNSLFTIPNICLINNFDLSYSVSHTKYLNCTSEYHDLRKDLDSGLVSDGCETKYEILSMRTLLDYVTSYTPPVSNDILKSISTKLCLEKKLLFDILSRFLLDKQAEDLMYHNSESLRGSELFPNIDLLALLQKDSCKTLQIWTWNKDQHSVPLLLYIPIIYQNLLANKENAPILSLFKQIEDGMGLEKSFTFTILLDTCAKLSFYSFYGAMQISYIDKYLFKEKIYSDIEKTIMGINLLTEPVTHNESSKLMQMTLRNLITLEQIEEFDKVVLYEISKITDLWTLRVTSVRINEVNGKDNLAYYQSFCTSNNSATNSTSN